MPFALLGVLLLLGSMFSMAYVSDLRSQHLEERIREDVIQEGREISALVHHEVETEAYLVGTTAVQLGAGNRSKIASLYNDVMESYLDATFPRRVEGFHIEIRDHNSSLVLVNGILEDFGKEVGIENDTFQNRSYEELDTANSGYWMELDRAMTFSVMGSVGYVMRSKGVVASHAHEFARDLDSLVPFLKGKMGSLASNMVSDFGDVSRIVKYALSTLAQMRVLQGWGSKAESAPKTSWILTRDDVERALNLALILESHALFRTADENAVGAFDYHNPTESGTTLEELMGDWGHSGRVDPSDLLLMFSGGEESNLSIGPIISQAIYAMVDQTTLKYFDYFGLVPVFDLTLQAAQMLSNSIQDFLLWISGEDRKAWLTRSWFRELAQDTGIGTLISYPLVFETTGFEFEFTTEGGEVVNFTVPVTSLYVPFEVRDLAVGFDAFWSDCYHLAYEVDVTTVHEGHGELIADLATRIGEVAEGAGATIAVSEAVDPSDNVSALRVASAMASETADNLIEQVRTNESLIKEIISKLWESQARMIANVFSRIESEVSSLVASQAKALAERAISEELLLELERGSAYQNLTAEDKERIAQTVEEEVAKRGLGEQALDEMLNRTIAELRDARARATSLNASSEEGGVYSRLRDFVVESSGILEEALEGVKELMDSIVESEDTMNSQFLIPLTELAFSFRKPGERPGEAGDREFRVNVAQNPAYLKTSGWPAKCDDGDVETGTLCVAVESPLEGDAGSGGNIHYTDVTRSSFAPYVSSWDIRVRSVLEISTTADRLHESPQGRLDAVNERVPLEFEFRVSIRSGWGLEGVEYDASDSFLQDLWETLCSFVDIVWEGLLKVFDWVLDGITWLVSLIRELCSTLLSYARDVLNAIYDVVEVTTQLLRSAIAGIAGIVCGLIESVVSAFGVVELRMSVLGGELEIGLNQGNGTVVKAVLETGGLSVTLLFKKLSDTNLTQDQRAKVESDYDVPLCIDIELGHLVLSGKFDPAMVLEGSFFRAQATWADDWVIELEVPHVERFHEKRYTLQIPSIPTPFGTLDLELGVLMKLAGQLRSVDLTGILSTSFEMAWVATLGKELSIDSAARFVHIGFSAAIDRFLQVVEGNLRNISQVVLYFEGQVRAGGSVGVGVRLVLEIANEVLLEGFSWISSKLRALISTLGGPPSIAVERGLAYDVTEGVFVGLEVLFSVGTPRMVRALSGGDALGADVMCVVSIRVNVAALGHLLGTSTGRWRADFGLYLEGLPPGLFGLDGQEGEQINLWLLRGSAYGA